MREFLLPTENPCASVLEPPQRKMKRAGLCGHHKTDPKPSTSTRVSLIQAGKANRFSGQKLMALDRLRG